MSVGRLVQLGALLVLLLWTTAVLAAEVDGPCGRERADWRQAYQRFKAGVEHYRQIKDESITPLIEKMIAEKGRSTSTAAAVRSVLEDRKLRMADARKKLDELLVEEKHRFGRLRGCASRSRRRSNRASRSNSDEQARENLMAGLPDLLMDEAYEQYKHQRPRSASRYSYYGSQSSPRERYQGQPAPRWRTEYYGGYGRPRQRYPVQRYPYQGYFRR